jgi:hypothetical protein
MTDRTKNCLSVFFFTSMFVLPPIGLGIGWISWNFKTGAVVALITFAALFLLGGIFLATVKNPTWLSVGWPFTCGLIYSILPDFIIGPIDDAAAVAAGAILSFSLWLRKQPDTPKWIILPWLAASLYTLVGGLVPGPIDELIVYFISSGATVYGAWPVLKAPASQSGTEGDGIEGELVPQD